MKNLLKKTLAILVITASFFSCSKSDDAPTPPEQDIEYENNTILNIPFFTISNANTPFFSGINVNKIAKLVDPSKLIVELNLEHTYQRDIIIELIGPNNASANIIYRVGGDKDYIGSNKLRFSSAFNNLLPNYNIDIPAGNYRGGLGLDQDPLIIDTPLFKKFQDISIDGEWTLRVTNKNMIYPAKLLSWKLIFGAGAVK